MLERDGHIIRQMVRPRGRCCSGACSFSKRGEIWQHWKRITLCAHRGRNLGPYEHANSLLVWEKVSLAPGDDGEGLSVPQSFGAGATLQSCYMTPCQPLTARTDYLYPTEYYLHSFRQSCFGCIMYNFYSIFNAYDFLWDNRRCDTCM